MNIRFTRLRKAKLRQSLQVKGMSAQTTSACPPLTCFVEDRIGDAHDRWDADCVALDLKLADAGLPFGTSGYNLAVRRGVYRLVEGVTLALMQIGKNASPRKPSWTIIHRAVLDAVDERFLASSRFVPTPFADPVLDVARRGIKQQVERHCDEAFQVRRGGIARAIGRARALTRLGSTPHHTPYGIFP
jgi:hypothetical protein